MPDLYWKKRWAETFGCLSLARFVSWAVCACAALRGARPAWRPRRRWCDWGDSSRWCRVGDRVARAVSGKGGTLSSSDGQRIPVAGKSRNAILDNATELAIVEPTTDTAGDTDLVFTLFDLLRMQFAPRLRDIGDQQLYRLSREQVRHLAPRVKGTLKQDLLLRPWDDFLRLADSLKLGWVTASLFISKLQAYPRQNILTWALQEYGRLIKMLFILRYLAREDDRLWINAQLHTGESLHALREFLLVADKG